MSEENEKKLKLRFKLKTGEEFEAEGDLSFIAAQKDSFLSLISSKTEEKHQNQLPRRVGSILPPIKNNIQSQPEPQIKPSPFVMPARAAIRQESPAPLNQPEAHAFAQTSAQTPILQPDMAIWDKIAYADGEDIIIRRKDKNIKPQSAALIILGAAKVLKERAQMAALELSKSLKLSGYLKENERLDRVLGPEIKDSCIIYEGSKRNRAYRITQKGLAKAFTTAERTLFAEESQNLKY